MGAFFIGVRKVSRCKRMTVSAIGIRGNYIQKATNYNDTECKNIVGGCGCIHAEIALLKKINPRVIILSHSPCMDCAKAIIKSNTEVVIYDNEYRIKDGIDLLRANGIQVIQFKQKQRKEKLTQRDIEGLMGMNSPVYIRGRGGAVRRK